MHRIICSDGISMTNRYKAHVKHLFFALLCALLVFGSIFAPVSAEAAGAYSSPTSEEDFNHNWKFIYSDPSGAQAINFDDSSWRTVRLPHDYSSELNYTNKGEAESGYLLGGTGWYRKHFKLPASDKGKIVQIHFDGVYMNSTIYINGRELGTHRYGYSPFSYDLSQDLICDGKTDNVISVKVDHRQFSSRWYSGSGITGSVTLSIQDPLHISHNGVKITAPDLSNTGGGNVRTHIQTTLTNGRNKAYNVGLVQTLYDENYRSVGSTKSTLTLKKGESQTVEQDMQSGNISLWTPDDPNLYYLRTDIIVCGQPVDTVWTRTGYRYTYMDEDTGFYINGRNIKLQGVCLHEDHGALGTAVNKSALRRQLEMMKEMGANAVRVTHNPASTELLELCDQMGLLVIEEAFDTWTMRKNGNTQDYGRWFAAPIADTNEIIGKEGCDIWAEYDLRQMVEHSRNCPSVIMYSVGNELVEGVTSLDYNYGNYAARVLAAIRKYDNERYVTIGDNTFFNKRFINTGNLRIQRTVNSVLMDDPRSALGLNYTDNNEYDSIHSENPSWPLYGSEISSALMSRDYYETAGTDNEKHQVPATGKIKTGWGATPWDAWEDIITRDFLAGGFIWAGFDYTGEPTPWNSTSSSGSGDPSPKSSYFGVVDLAGIKKDVFYFYQSQWNHDVTTLHVAPYWNGSLLAKDNDGNVEVRVYSNAASVELFLNGESLGRKDIQKITTAGGHTYYKSGNDMYLTWQVPYEDGVLEAVAYDSNGNEISETSGRSVTETASPATHIRLVPYDEEVYADGKSVTYVTAEAVDDNGNVDPAATQRVTFNAGGSGYVVAADNGDPTDTTQMKSPYRHLFYGKAAAVVGISDNAGTITLTASADGLGSTSVDIAAVSEPSNEPPSYHGTAAHRWDSGVITRKATLDVTGKKEFTCSNCGATRTDSIPKLQAGLLLASVTSPSVKNTEIKWNKVTGAERYIVYVARCNTKKKKYDLKAVKTVNGNVQRFKVSKLSKGCYYKFKVVAQRRINGKYTAYRTSPLSHFIAGNVNGKYTNPSNLTLKKYGYTIKKGKTVKISPSVKPAVKKKYLFSGHAAKFRYLSSNKNIATVNGSGVITARSVGSCTVYVIGVNGIWKSISVRVN